MASGLKYDVFLSFKGSDTRKGITSELYHQLTQRGIQTYMDTNLKAGDVISPSLVKTMEDSRFAIVILSPNYASSTWCLQEIAKICRSMEYSNGILPLFFNVEPDDVLHLKGSFEEAFTKYENDGLYRPEKLQEWKDALIKVANFKGWNSKNYKTERELIEDIVENMYKMVQHSKCNFGEMGDIIKGASGGFIKGASGGFVKGASSGLNTGGPGSDIMNIVYGGKESSDNISGDNVNQDKLGN